MSVNKEVLPLSVAEVELLRGYCALAISMAERDCSRAEIMGKLEGALSEEQAHRVYSLAMRIVMTNK